MIRQGEEAFPALANKKRKRCKYRLFFTLKNCGKIMHLKSITLTISSYVIWYFPCLIFFSNFKHLKMQKILHRFPTIFCWTIAVLLGIYKKTVFWWKFLSWMHQHSKQQLNKHTHWARNYKNSWKEIFFFMEYFP